MLKYILFDLDGTLLPMNQEVFIKSYFKEISITMKPYFPDSKKLIDSIWAGTKAMMKNDGSMTNEKRFWNMFATIYGEDVLKYRDKFDSFYKNDFPKTKKDVGYNAMAKECVEILKDKGYTLVLATNPIFPSTATYHRADWAGVKTSDFELITTYENSTFAKGNMNYYKEILAKIGASAEQCLMVGNDVSEDMSVSEINMQTYLMKDCIINSQNKDINNIPQGNFADFKKYIEKLPNIK